MKINFNTQAMNEYHMEKAGMEKEPVTKGQKSSVYAGTITSFDGASRVCGQETEKKAFGNKEKTSLKEIALQADGTDVESLQNRMLLCAQTMSEEDYSKMQEEGFDPANMTPAETVTILDKIKAEMIKSGQEIIGYTDSIDITTLSAAVGNEGLARDIVAACSAEDLPVTEQNAGEIASAVQVGKEIPELTENAQAYLLENHLEPTIYELSLAAFGNNGTSGQGYASQYEQGMETTSVSEEELTRFLEQNEIEVNEDNVNTAKWLMKHSLEISRENIECKQGMEQLQFPLTQELLVKASVAAISDGKKAIEGNLLDTDSLWQKSAASYQNLTNRIKLEEVRLMMTSDANLALLESDFSIDTAEMEKVIDELKDIREKMAKNLFPNAEEPTELYERFEETENYLGTIRNMPIDTIGTVYDRIAQMELPEVAAEGKMMETRLREAGQQYETLMTAPRADLGDRIQKAFANVDDILLDYELEQSELNRKAVRTLAYCRMDIVPNNIESIKNALSTVQNLTEKMTPAAVLQMLRDGVNPLEQSMEELLNYLEELPENLREEGEKYSRFLYHLDQNKEITPEERESFIGCFRLLRQIEKSDGALIGDLVNTGAEWNFKNILSSMRSRKAQGSNLVVDDTIGALTDGVEIKNSIAAQIQTVFSATAQKEYEREAYRQYREQMATVSQDLLQEMQQRELELTPDYMQAMNTLLEEPDVVLNKIREFMGKAFAGSEEKSIEGSQEDPDQVVREESSMKELPSEYEVFSEEMDRTLEEAVEKVQEEMFLQDRYLDVKSLQLMHKQLSVMEQLTGRNEYFFTLQLSEERTSAVHLQFASDAEQKGTIRFDISDPQMGKISGELRLAEDTLQGYLMGNLPETVMKMQSVVDIIGSKLPESVTLGRVDTINEKSWTTGRSQQSAERTKAQNPEVLYRIATVFLKEILA